MAGVEGHEAHKDVGFVRVKAHLPQLLSIRREHGRMQVEQFFVGIHPFLPGAQIGQKGAGGEDFGGDMLANIQTELADLRIFIQKMGLTADPRGDGQHGGAAADENIRLVFQTVIGVVQAGGQKEKALLYNVLAGGMRAENVGNAKAPQQFQIAVLIQRQHRHFVSFFLFLLDDVAELVDPRGVIDGNHDLHLYSTSSGCSG